MTENKKKYQLKILIIRKLLRESKIIEAYDELGKILEDMEK
jgi:hypothetical protein